MEKVRVGIPKQIGAYLVQSADHITGATGRTLTIEISKAGNVFQEAEADFTEVGYGWYDINFTSNDLGALGFLKVHISATGADPVDFELEVVAEFVSTTNPFTGQVDSYLTIDEGDAFFSTEMEHEAWDTANNDQKNRAIATATRLIDRLNFAGDKHDSEQVLEFPRNDDTTIPEDIKIACALICYALLDGVDVEEERRSLDFRNVSFSGVSGNYDRAVIHQAYLHNIPSVKAWSHLRPYLRDTSQITISRIN